MNTFPPSEEVRGKLGVLMAAGFLGIVAYSVPLFVRMPLTNDAQMYDLQVRLLAEGGTLYRDILEPNLPGAVWIQSLVRTTLGSSSDALRLFDLFMLGGALFLVDRWFRALNWSPASRLGLLTVCWVFYVSQSEWCQCQRDSWLLLPVLAALTCRRHLVETIETNRRLRIFAWALAEGFLWGMAVWLKPHILIPAALVWGVFQWRTRPGIGVLWDLAGMMIGGLVVGAIGSWWMIETGCWEPFWQTMREWNPRYFAAGREHWTLPRLIAMTWRLSPWILLHIPAAVIAVRSLRGVGQSAKPDRSTILQSLLAACYLGWTVQAFLLQHLFDYVHVPPMFLAILIVAVPLQKSLTTVWGRALLISFAVLAILASPMFRPSRAKLWETCLTTTASPQLYSKLAVLPNPNWRDLDRVARFLAEQNPASGDVCCFHSDLVSLYNRLELLPPTRFVYVQETLVFFPDRQGEILKRLRESSARFVVTDMWSARLSLEQKQRLLSPAFQHALQKPSAKPRPYPWGSPVVFRSGNYSVHRETDR